MHTQQSIVGVEPIAITLITPSHLSAVLWPWPVHSNQFGDISKFLSPSHARRSPSCVIPPMPRKSLNKFGFPGHRTTSLTKHVHQPVLVHSSVSLSMASDVEAKCASSAEMATRPNTSYQVQEHDVTHHRARMQGCKEGVCI